MTREDDMTTRERFVGEFGEDEAGRIEQAAAQHRREDPNPLCRLATLVCEVSAGRQIEEAEDQFLLDIATCISWECVSRFRKHHGFKSDPETLRAWIKEYAVPPEKYRDPAGVERYAEYLA